MGRLWEAGRRVNPQAISNPTGQATASSLRAAVEIRRRASSISARTREVLEGRAPLPRWQSGSQRRYTCSSHLGDDESEFARALSSAEPPAKERPVLLESGWVEPNLLYVEGFETIGTFGPEPIGLASPHRFENDHEFGRQSVASD